MKKDLDSYISSLFYDNNVRPSLKMKFQRQISKTPYNYDLAFDFFKKDEDTVRKAFHGLSDEDWNELLRYFALCGLHFGMTEEECMEYMDKDYTEKYRLKILEQLWNEANEVIANMDDAELARNVREIINGRDRFDIFRR